MELQLTYSEQVEIVVEFSDMPVTFRMVEDENEAIQINRSGLDLIIGYLLYEPEQPRVITVFADSERKCLFDMVQDQGDIFQLTEQSLVDSSIDEKCVQFDADAKCQILRSIGLINAFFVIVGNTYD